METILRSLGETQSEAEKIVRTVAENPSRSGATVLALYGDLGSGKTAFTKGVARALGIEAEVTSPTFVIEKVYALDHPVFDRLIHIDAYRLVGADDLRVIGWDDIVRDPKNLIVVEWADQVEELMPKDVRRLRFAFVDEKTRTFVCQPS